MLHSFLKQVLGFYLLVTFEYLTSIFFNLLWLNFKIFENKNII